MSLKPRCGCWSDPKRVAQRESEARVIATAVRETARLNAYSVGICGAASPYIVAIAMAQLAALAWNNVCGEPTYPGHEKFAEGTIAFLDELVTEAKAYLREQVQSAVVDEAITKTATHPGGSA